MSRTSVGIIAALAGAAVLVGVMFGQLYASRGRLSSLQARQQEVLSLQAEHQALAGKLRRLEGKSAITNVQGLARAVDEVFEPLGLKDKVKSFKVVGTEAEGEERGEITVSGADMNEMVNFLHSIENSPMPLVIKKISIRTSFEDPGSLNVTMTLSFIGQS